jgi:hypothetical protein
LAHFAAVAVGSNPAISLRSQPRLQAKTSGMTTPVIGTSFLIRIRRDPGSRNDVDPPPAGTNRSGARSFLSSRHDEKAASWRCDRTPLFHRPLQAWRRIV